MSQTPVLVDVAALERLAQKLRTESSIAVDLEADSLHSYRDKVCLLQISTPTETVLVDPLALADLAPLEPILADPAIRKIFHAADYDIRCLHRDFGFEIRGLFDTMIASQLLGEERVGLADMLQKYLEVSLDKRYQRADWSKRPLEPGMIRYAAEDTRHLHRLAALLEQRLRDAGRLSWAEEEFALLEQVRHSEQAPGPMFLRFKGAAGLDRRQLAALELLLQWRDGEACRRDRPPFKVLINATLLGLVQAAPQTLKALESIDGISPRLVERYGRRLLALLEDAAALPEAELPSFPRGERRVREPEVEARVALLKRWRGQIAEDLALDPGVLINNALLEEAARLRPRQVSELAALPLKNWQRQVLGEGLVAALAEQA